MAKRYPREGGSRLIKGYTIPCAASGCSNQATRVVTIQFGWMRGSDDACVVACDAHKNVGLDVEKWCDQFPKEAWKD